MSAKKLWLCAIAWPVGQFFLENMCVWPAPRFLWIVASSFIFVSAITFLFIPWAFSASIICGIRGLLRWKKGDHLMQSISRSGAYACMFALGILSNAMAEKLRHDAFVRASHVGDRIVRALACYYGAHSRYPDQLEQLVPGDLPKIPYTGMIGYPDFSYAKDQNDLQPTLDSYELRINCGSGGINFDRFIYWPSEKYPDRIQDNRVERIRSWAYVHE